MMTGSFKCAFDFMMRTPGHYRFRPRTCAPPLGRYAGTRAAGERSFWNSKDNYRVTHCSLRSGRMNLAATFARSMNSLSPPNIEARGAARLYSRLLRTASCGPLLLSALHSVLRGTTSVPDDLTNVSASQRLASRWCADFRRGIVTSTGDHVDIDRCL